MQSDNPWAAGKGEVAARPNVTLPPSSTSWDLSLCCLLAVAAGTLREVTTDRAGLQGKVWQSPCSWAGVEQGVGREWQGQAGKAQGAERLARLIYGLCAAQSPSLFRLVVWPSGPREPSPNLLFFSPTQAKIEQRGSNKHFVTE